jgi:tellurite resistance protein TerC
VDVSWWVWLGFALVVGILLLIDLLVFGQRGSAPSFRRAVAWSIGWTVTGLGFAVVLWLWRGSGIAEEYLAGFVIEKSLSIDNLFVFAMVFAALGVPAIAQRRVLFWGIVGAIVLRGIFILAGAALLDAFHVTIYVFGGFLVVTGLRMLRHRQVTVVPERNPALRALARVVPQTTTYDGDRLVTREGGRRVATPLLAALVLVAVFDVVFAVDSIPAIFAVTRETFVVYAANAFSLLGLTALYFVLRGLLDRFAYLHVGLGIVLVFVGAKMALSDIAKIPAYASLAVIVSTLAASIAASLLRDRADRSPAARPEADGPLGAS